MNMFKRRIALVGLISLVTAGTALGDAQSLSENLQGSESNVKGSASVVNEQAKEAFDQLGIVKTGSSSEKNGTEQSLTGKKGDMTVEVQLKESGKDVTHIGVVAKQGTFHWNKDYSRTVLSKIVEIG